MTDRANNGHETGSTPGDDRFVRAAIDAILAREGALGLCALSINGLISHWHASAEALLGHPASAMIGTRLDALGPEERRHEMALPRALFQASAQDSLKIEYALLTRRGDRRVFTLDIHLNRDTAAGTSFVVLIDPVVSSLVRTPSTPQRDDRAAAHRMNLISADGEPGWLGLDLNADITHANEPAVTRLAQARADLIGRPLDECVRSGDGRSWIELMHEVIRDRAPLPVDIVRGTGDRPLAGAVLVALYGADNRLDGFTLRLNGTVERSSRPSDRRTAPQTLPTQRMDKAWLTAATHDLREPMRKISQFVASLEEDEAERLSEDGRAQLEKIGAAMGRLNAMVDGVMRLARVDVAPFTEERVPLNRVIDEVRDDLSRLIAEHEADIRVDDLGVIEGDAAQLRSLFQNLVDNSIRYRRPDATPQILIQSANPEYANGTLTIEYRDNGKGIESPETVFSALPGARSNIHGTGIGLGLCRRICRRHNGDLEIRHSDVEGTVFLITLAREGHHEKSRKPRPKSSRP